MFAVTPLVAPVLSFTSTTDQSSSLVGDQVPNHSALSLFISAWTFCISSKSLLSSMAILFLAVATDCSSALPAMIGFVFCSIVSSVVSILPSGFTRLSDRACDCCISASVRGLLFAMIL